MNSRFRHELSPVLAVLADAVDASPPGSATEAAQGRLMARLRGARSRGRRGVQWLAATASAAVLATLVVAWPLFLDQGRAFAAVQAHFRAFDTLAMRMEQRIDGQLLQSSDMVVNADGVLRTDVGDQLSIVVDPVHGRMLTLLHGRREAMLVPLAPSADPRRDGLAWLEELRDFKGRARPLDEPRVIDGRTAHGWALDVGGNPLVLWADDQGLPLAMETDVPGGLAITYRFEFDAPVPAGHLSSEVPRDYRLVSPD